ncbi:MAG: DinB family protein, partial [Bryobacterales bacterium]|nr:DinB family protein [Bryobacterales bacterium]
MTNHLSLSAFPELYFRGLATGNLAMVPWSDDVVFQGSVHEQPLQGRKAVEAFLTPLLPGLSNVELLATYSRPETATVVGEAQVGPLYVMDRFIIRDGRIVEQRNVYDPRPLLGPAEGAMTPADRRRLVEMLAASQQAFEAAVARVPEQRWAVRPDVDSWSAAECAEHLILSEEALLNLVRNQILKSPATQAASDGISGKNDAVVEAMRDRKAKSQTFDFLILRGRWLTQRNALDAFRERRQATLDYVWTSQDPLHAHGAPLPGLDLLDGYQWLLL